MIFPAIVQRGKLALLLAQLFLMHCAAPCHKRRRLGRNFCRASSSRKEKSAQGFTYMTSGVSSDERAAMADKGKDFNVKLVFAAKDGSFLANVNITIAGAKGAGAFTATATGPLVLRPFAAGEELGNGGRLRRAKERDRGAWGRKEQRIYQVFVWDLAPAQAPAA